MSFRIVNGRFCPRLCFAMTSLPLWFWSLLFFSSFSHAADTEPVTFVGIELTHMRYYPEMHITEESVHRDMAKVIAEHGRVIDFSTVQDVASRITAIYRGAGFVFTRAYIPQQRSANGWVEVRLLEGWLSSIDVLDNHRYSETLLAKPFADLKNKVVYNPEVEEAIALLNDYPGLNAFGFYSVGEEPGSTRINIRAQRERDWLGTLRADNYGSNLTGQNRLLAEWEKFNPTGHADDFRISALQTFNPQNATYGQLDYNFPIIDKRSQIEVRASSDTFVVSRGQGNELVEIDGKAYSSQLELKRKLKRGQAENINGSVGISRNISVSNYKTGASDSFEQKTWEAYTDIEFDHLDRKRGQWYGATISLVDGRYDSIDVPGQARQYRYAHGTAAYSKAISLTDAAHEWKFNLDWQYTRDLLPAISQYSLTGPTHLRGFMPGVFSSDTGAIATTTWTFPSLSLRHATSDRKCGITTSLFAEYGYGIQNSPSPNTSDSKGTLSDAGIAWLFTWGPELSATLTLAKPVSYDVDYESDRVTALRAWLEIVWRFNE